MLQTRVNRLEPSVLADQIAVKFAQTWTSAMKVLVKTALGF